MSNPFVFGKPVRLQITNGVPGAPGPPGPGGGVLTGDYVFANASLSPYPLVAGSLWVAVDTRAGPVTVNFPSAAASVNQVFTLVDQYNNWAIFGITLVCPAGVTAWNPNAPGTYAQTVFCGNPNSPPLRYKFSASAQVWLPW